MRVTDNPWLDMACWATLANCPFNCSSATLYFMQHSARTVAECRALLASRSGCAVLISKPLALRHGSTWRRRAFCLMLPRGYSIDIVRCTLSMSMLLLSLTRLRRMSFCCCAICATPQATWHAEHSFGKADACTSIASTATKEPRQRNGGVDAALLG